MWSQGGKDISYSLSARVDNDPVQSSQTKGPSLSIFSGVEPLPEVQDRPLAADHPHDALTRTLLPPNSPNCKLQEPQTSAAPRAVRLASRRQKQNPMHVVPTI